MQSQRREMPSADYASSHDCCGQVRRADCVDLKKVFGRRYRLEYEDPHFAGSRCPWHRQIKCRRGRGFISPAGGEKLHAYGCGPAARELEELASSDPSNYRVAQGNTQEIGIEFDLEHFAPVAAILRPVRR